MKVGGRASFNGTAGSQPASAFGPLNLTLHTVSPQLEMFGFGSWLLADCVPLRPETVLYFGGIRDADANDSWPGGQHSHKEDRLQEIACSPSPRPSRSEVSRYRFVHALLATA